MSLGTSNLRAADFNPAFAAEGPLKQVWDDVDGRRRCDSLENRPRNHRRPQHPVDEHAFIGRVVVPNLRRVLGVEGGRGNHAQNLAGFIIVDSHRPPPAVQSAVGGGAELGVQGQRQILSAAVDSSNGVITGQLAGEAGLDARTHPALGVAYGVHRAQPDGPAVVILPSALRRLNQNLTVSVQHPASAQTAVGV